MSWTWTWSWSWTRGHLSIAKVLLLLLLPDENLHNHAKCGKLLRAINGDSIRPTCERTWLASAWLGLAWLGLAWRPEDAVDNIIRHEQLSRVGPVRAELS